MDEDILKQVNDALDEAIKSKKRSDDIIRGLGPAILEALAPALDGLQLSKQDILEAVSKIKIDAPIIPKFDIPKAEVDVKIPAIKVPAPQVTVNVPPIKIPAIKLPTINVPKPEVTVNIPPIKFPDFKIPSDLKVMLKDINRKNPMPVHVMNQQSFSFPRVLAIKGIFGDNDSSILDITNNAIRANIVAGSVSITGFDTNQGPSGANTLRVVIATDSVSSVNLINQDQNSGPVSPNTLRVVQAVDVGSSVNVIADFRDTNIGPSGANTLRVTMATDAVSSVNLINQAQGSGEANANSLRIIQASDANSSIFVTGANGTIMAVGDIQELTADNNEAPIKMGVVARTTNPSKATDGQRRGAMGDAIGRQVITPVQVRGLRSTAYVTLNTNSETTLLAGVASTFLDLIWVKFANTSSGAVSVDVRDGTGAGVIDTIAIPANATQGASYSVPVPQNSLANTWTVKFNTDNGGGDLSNTKVYVSALFDNEV